MNNIAGALVLYHPDYNVLDNIYSYIDTIDILFVYDNSEKIDDHLLIEKIREIPKVIYTINNENIGIAAALNDCARKALAKDYKWLLTMDQDSRADEKMVNEMASFCKTFSHLKVGILSPQHINYLTPAVSLLADYQEVSLVMTSGNLLSLDAYVQTGPFNENYFIDYVDIEYCLRLLDGGYKIIMCTKAHLYHQLGDISKHNIFGIKSIYTTNHPPLRLYYIIRNMLFTWKEFKNTHRDLYKNDALYLLKRILKIFFLETSKIKKLVYIMRGYLDYKNNILGKYIK